MYKITSNENYERINLDKLKKKIKINLEEINKKRKIPKRLKVWERITEYGEVMWCTDHSYIGKKNRRDVKRVISYDKKLNPDLLWFERYINDFYFGPEPGKDDRDFRKGETLDIIAKTVAVLIYQLEKIEGREYIITIDLVNDTRLFDKEVEVFLHFYEVRKDCYESYKHFRDGADIRVDICN